MNTTTESATQELATTTPPSPQEQAAFPIRFTLGFISLLFRTASEVTRIAGEIHHVASDHPNPFSREHKPSIENAPKLYQLIQLAFIHSANQLHKLNQHIPDQYVPSKEVTRLQSVMNGVFGDKLHDWDHPSAIDMHFLDRQHHSVNLRSIQAEHPNGIAIFIHGLCLSEHEWRGPEPEKFMDHLEKKGIGSIIVRYNTGLTLAENGENLAKLIQDQWQEQAGQKIILFGHSMGGLIARSAIFHSEYQSEYSWHKDVSHSAYLASPHEGAVMERIGEAANSLLGHSPYTKPLMTFGNIRSRGIRSLHDSHIHSQNNNDSCTPCFNPNIHHLLIGARLSDPIARYLLGDGLVDHKSAMGSRYFPDDHAVVHKMFLENVGHLKLLQDPRLYQALSNWLSDLKQT
ncbi:MAG: GPI inositol-deacylase [Pseudomonadales bacterium]|nr:GPI inositol-deacylase [Pseudomonadales bacterium]